MESEAIDFRLRRFEVDEDVAASAVSVVGVVERAERLAGSVTAALDCRWASREA